MFSKVMGIADSRPRAVFASSTVVPPVPPCEIGSVPDREEIGRFPVTEFDKFTFPLIIS